MKDLGYPRTPTDAKIRVTMPDGSRWDVPVQVIADSRDEFYATDQEDTIGLIRAGRLYKYEITDWAAGNMNWIEVVGCATEVPRKEVRVNYQEGWTNGEKEIIGTI